MTTRHSIAANGTTIHYLEAGRGAPLVLLHGGLSSSSEIWAGHPAGLYSYVADLAEHFRVILPDTRGHGRTPNPDGGPVSYALLAADVHALIDVLDVARPVLAGFSDGGVTATIAAIQQPDSVRAVINYAGFDLLNPTAPSFAMSRQMFGGSPEATRPDPAAWQSFFGAPHMQGFLDLMRADHEAPGGTNTLAGLIDSAFDRLSRHGGEATIDDLAKVTAPTLILTGDRDICCTVEEAVAAYRALPDGELAILPGVGHYVAPQAIATLIDFARRHDAKE